MFSKYWGAHAFYLQQHRFSDFKFFQPSPYPSRIFSIRFNLFGAFVKVKMIDLCVSDLKMSHITEGLKLLHGREKDSL